ncbi:hypothetical protein Cpir12675_005211 [Ceratocystis pirilliformis]|uniref:RWD domain-containing protein n=1 Tax=Ceratocystis pirilliformis TaxID=259994 RepID=A0ABR3YRB4_9PEZI
MAATMLSLGSIDAFSHVDSPKKGIGNIVASAFDSDTFDADITISVMGRVGSATISPCGRDIALASPDGLSIIDLDSPDIPPRKLSTHGMPWLVVDAQWSPFASRDYWVVSTANHRALVWNLNMKEDSVTGAIEHSLQGHSRAITDINFSAHHPDILSTCSVDGTVHCWDLRRPRQPVMTFYDWFAGATQVKFSRQDAHILVSSHDRWLRFWDDRKSCEPVKSILAHKSKIYGIDWNRTRADELITCSLDKTIKFWDISADDYGTPQHVIRTEFPVWRARHTPFGSGIVAIPQVEPGNMYLYDRPKELHQSTDIQEKTEPVAVFPGHGNNAVKEFLWRTRGGIDDDGMDAREFQLVSWGEDNKLHLQKPDDEILRAIGYTRGSRAPDKLQLTRKGATYKTFTTIMDSNMRDMRVTTMSDIRPNAGIKHTSALTLGMKNGQLQSKRGSSGVWRGSAMKVRSRNGSRGMESSQINWMKGVSVTKRRSLGSAGGHREPSRRFMSGRDSPVFSILEEWQGPEQVEVEPFREEVISLSSKLPKVTWIYVDPTKAVASLQGPWGEKKKNIYFEVSIAITPGYPLTEAPTFDIQGNIYMDAKTRAKLEEDVHTLAQQHKGHGKNCLHSVFKYLLGDVDLQSSLRFLKNVHNLADLSKFNPEESSSSDEDGNTTDMRASSTLMSMDLTASSEANSLAANVINRTALPLDRRTCGARFSHDGRLVCFFLTQEEKTRATFMGSASDSSKERKTAGPYSVGFGRMAFESPLRQQQRFSDYGSDSENCQSDSEETDSSMTSSNSEDTSMHKTSWYRPSGRLRMIAWSETHSVHSSDGGTGLGTVTGTGVGRRRLGRPKNIVSMHDISALLPSKRKYAKYYEVFGDDVCSHNAAVAERYGNHELRDVWLFCALLLRKGIPLEQVDAMGLGLSLGVGGSDRQNPVLLVALSLVDQHRESLTNGSFGHETPLTTRVRWGTHPMARQFVDTLFDYFEQMGDIQMLALLSCIFVEPMLDDDTYRDGSNGLSFDAQLRPNQSYTPLAYQAPGFSLPFFKSTEAFWRSKFSSRNTSSRAIPLPTPTPVQISGSQMSVEDTSAFLADSNSQLQSQIHSQAASRPHSVGGTPPTTRSSRDYKEHGGMTSESGQLEPPPSQAQSQAPSLSASPNTRSFWKQASFSAHIPRAIATAMSSSPPNTRKKASPAEQGQGSSGNGNVTWGNTTIMGENGSLGASTAGSGPASRANNHPSDDEARRSEFCTEMPVGVEIMLEDQSMFDDDNVCTSVPLLNSSRNHLYASYRYSYAELLQIWQLPLQRLEILKFNLMQKYEEPPHMVGSLDSEDSLRDSFATPSTAHELKSAPVSSPASVPKSASTTAISSSVLLGRKLAGQYPNLVQRGLDVTGVCRIHEQQLDPLNYTLSNTDLPLLGGAVGTCPRCHETQRQLRCVYCLEPLDAQYTPCLSCGCAAHDACLAEWHAAGEELCPAGDECNCVEEASSGQVETWEAMMGSLGRSRRGTMSLSSLPLNNGGSSAGLGKPSLPIRAHHDSLGLGMGMGMAMAMGRAHLHGAAGYAVDDAWDMGRNNNSNSGPLHESSGTTSAINSTTATPVRDGKARAARASTGAQEAAPYKFAFRSKMKRQNTGVWARTQAAEGEGTAVQAQQLHQQQQGKTYEGGGGGGGGLQRSVGDIRGFAGLGGSSSSSGPGPGLTSGATGSGNVIHGRRA